jgi:hypothetical protein
MTHDANQSPATDPDFRRMVKWVLIALVGVLALAAVVVEATLRWFGVE